jgi:hypothetical protein
VVDIFACPDSAYMKLRLTLSTCSFLLLIAAGGPEFYADEP